MSGLAYRKPCITRVEALWLAADGFFYNSLFMPFITGGRFSAAAALRV